MIMKPTTIIFALIAFVALTGLFIFGYDGSRTAQTAAQNTDNASLSESVLFATEKFHDFGTISMKNGNVSKDFAVTNTTGKSITIAKVETSCMCTSALIVRGDGSTKGPFGMVGMGYVPPANETVPPGGSIVIRVVYDPNAHGPAGVGMIDRLVTITDEGGGTLELEVKAMVTP